MPRRNANCNSSAPYRRQGRHHDWPRCAQTGKLRLGERKDVGLALRDIAAGRSLAEASGYETRRRECRGYQCTHCHGWHLTSIRSWSTNG